MYRKCYKVGYNYKNNFFKLYSYDIMKVINYINTKKTFSFN